MTSKLKIGSKAESAEMKGMQKLNEQIEEP